MTRFPGFTAEACTAGGGAAPAGRGYRTAGRRIASEAVSPQWRRVRMAHPTTVTCEAGSTVCEEYCQHAGGGMSSNPDGSTTCTVY